MGEAHQAPQPGGLGLALLTPHEEGKFLADWAQEALAALRRDWGADYEIGIGPVSQFAARRRDGAGEWITAEEPGDLGAALAAGPDAPPVPAS